MSTDRLEVKPDVTSETLEQSAEQLKKDGVDISKEAVVNADGDTATLSEIKTEEIQSSEDRPQWLPEKFKTAEELAKAYTGLEKEFSSRSKEEVKPVEQTNEVPEQGLEKYYSEFAETGELTDKSYADLAKQGLDKTLVDSYIDGQKLVAETNTKTIQDVAGGKEEYAELLDWAGKNLSSAEQKVYNDLVDTGDIETAKFAVQGLLSKSGKNSKQQSLYEGTSDEVTKDAFGSVAQVTEAMNDPRYDKDPAYRKSVEDKIARSTVF